jgi:hypothetical protein
MVIGITVGKTYLQLVLQVLNENTACNTNGNWYYKY